MRGIASDIGMPIISDLKSFLPSTSPDIIANAKQKYRVFSWNDDANLSHILIEALPQRFVEFVDQRPRTCFTEIPEKTKDGILRLDCAFPSRVCEVLHGAKCETFIELNPHNNSIRIKSPGVEGPLNEKCYPLTADSFEFLPTAKFKPYQKGKDNAILAFYGSFAPIHIGHLEALDMAKKYIEETLNIPVFGAYVSPLSFLRIKKGVFADLLQWRERAAMCESLLRDHPYAYLDPEWRHTTFQEKTFTSHPVTSIPGRVRKALGLSDSDRLTVFWVNGSDAYFDKELWNQAKFEEISDPPHTFIKHIVINRGGDARNLFKEVFFS